MSDEEYYHSQNKRKKHKKHRKHRKSNAHYDASYEHYHNHQTQEHPPQLSHSAENFHNSGKSLLVAPSVQSNQLHHSHQQNRPIPMSDSAANLDSKSFQSQFTFVNKDNFNDILIDPTKLNHFKHDQSSVNHLMNQESSQSINISDLIVDQQKRLKMSQLSSFSNCSNNLMSEPTLYNEKMSSSSSSTSQQSATDLNKDQLCEYAYIVYKPGSNYIAMSRSLNELIPPDTTVIYKMDETSNKKDKQRIKSQSLMGDNKIELNNNSNKIKVSKYPLINLI